MSNFINFRSPAKLNLGLKIVGKRNDGYHLMHSIFCLIDLMDEVALQITHNAKISLIEHQQDWPPDTDLAYKAAKLLQKTTNTNLGCNIKLHKIIPSGAGLGGGSSNAATVLMALNKLWHTNLSTDELINLGKQLGADVPFFIYGKNAFASGIGDEFTPIELPQLYFVLIKPSFNIPTKNIFTNLNFISLPANQSQFNCQHLLQTKENDLQIVASKLYPQLNPIIND